MKKNRLAEEKNPYLLQHADNPVDWHPWGDEAFREAERTDKPVFLSIGYSTCHWCHVMARESFEDQEVARLLNDTFICVKVDREERPDIDQIYMTACQMLTGAGGWPLSIFMAPDRRPFYAATYIPKESRYGRIGLLDLIPRIHDLWKTKRQDVLNAAADITAHLARNEFSAPGPLSVRMIDEAYKNIEAGFDQDFGGFGPAPKFPIPHQLLFLLRYWKGTDNPRALSMVTHTLAAMRCGGIYDHLGFGFHRYSTDRRWLIPHFEKMLYDQALLALAYTEAYQAAGDDAFQATAREIFTYVLRDMSDPGGGFYSAEDADSEGEEGLFYLWTDADIRTVLPPDEADLIIQVFGVERDGNYRDEATQMKTGRNILHWPQPLDTMAKRIGLPEHALRERMASAREKLFTVRERRSHPHKDDKILTDWNGLMIAALARGAQTLGEPAYLERAEAAATFIFKKLHGENGRLLHRWCENEAAVSGHLDDYAFLIWGLLECYEASFDPGHLRRALDLQDTMDRHFWDAQNGGYFFTPDDSETVIARRKESYDGAIPSGNAVAMLNLIRLGRLTGEKSREDRARKVGEAFAALTDRAPSGHTMFMATLAWLFYDARELVIAGDPAAPDTQTLLNLVRRVYFPNKTVLLRSPAAAPEIAVLAPFAKNMGLIDGKATAYVCFGQTCRSPTTDPAVLLKHFKG